MGTTAVSARCLYQTSCPSPPLQPVTSPRDAHQAGTGSLASGYLPAAQDAAPSLLHAGGRAACKHLQTPSNPSSLPSEPASFQLIFRLFWGTETPLLLCACAAPQHDMPWTIRKYKGINKQQQLHFKPSLRHCTNQARFIPTSLEVAA